LVFARASLILTNYFLPLNEALCLQGSIVNKNPTHCSTCKTVSVICFWGDMPVKKWKRPFIFIASVLILSALVYWQFFSGDLEAAETSSKIISIIVGAMFLLGLITSIFGCDKCVAKVCGSA
jgi:hypothetical protein